MKLTRGGCLETAGVAVFAVLLGAFAASTWLHHRRPAGSEEPAPIETLVGNRLSVERARIRVEVRNGSGLEGAAGRMTGFLRDRGFDVVDFGNADRFDHPRTFVVDRGGGPRAAREVAAALQGVPIETAGDVSPYLDVTVMVGRDIDDVLTQRATEERGWRRWLDKLPWR